MVGLIVPVLSYAADPIRPPKYYDLNKHAIPKGYYEMECIIPPDISVFEWLTLSQWADKYERNGWDCSKMSAFVEWALENCDIPSKIVLGSGSWADAGHAWVNMKIDGEEFYYEATSRLFIGSKQDALAYGYEDDFRADEILTLRRYYSSNVDFLREWGWWITVSEYYYILYEQRSTRVRFAP
jgi:hypothetical protein